MSSQFLMKLISDPLGELIAEFQRAGEDMIEADCVADRRHAKRAQDMIAAIGRYRFPSVWKSALREEMIGEAHEGVGSANHDTTG